MSVMMQNDEHHGIHSQSDHKGEYPGGARPWGLPLGLWARLFGTNTDSLVHHHGLYDRGEKSAPPTSVSWTSVLRQLNWAEALENLHVPTNFWYAAVVGLMFFWLSAVYWVSHHKGLANRLIGIDPVGETQPARSFRRGDRELLGVTPEPSAPPVYGAAYALRSPSGPIRSPATSSAIGVPTGTWAGGLPGYGKSTYVVPLSRGRWVILRTVVSR